MNDRQPSTNNVGVITAQAEAVSSKVLGVRVQIGQELSTISTRLEASAAFIGGGQAAAIQECFRKIHAEVAKIFNFLTDDTNGKSLRTYIKEAVAKYGTISEAIVKNFNL
jgi:predicted PP-loop superfamily ATPase